MIHIYLNHEEMRKSNLGNQATKTHTYFTTLEKLFLELQLLDNDKKSTQVIRGCICVYRGDAEAALKEFSEIIVHDKVRISFACAFLLTWTI